MPSAPVTSTYSLSVESLSAVRGGRPLFHDVAFVLHAGDILQVDGANGTGKTTLLNMVSGLSQPRAGCVRWCGEPLPVARSELNQSLAYLGHQHGLKAALTPLENLRWSLGLAGVPWRQEQALRELIALGLADVLEQASATLSAGQRRRVALARVFLSSKSLWVLDEPLTALDRQVVPVIESRLREHAQAGGMIVLTAHQTMNLGSAHRMITLEAAHA